MKFFYSLGILVSLVGCNNIDSKKGNQILIDNFPKIATLKAEELIIPSILLKPSNTCIIDTFLVVTQRRQDTIFSIFSLPTCKYLMSFGNKGRGPNEFNLSFENVTLGPVNRDSSSFAVGNMMTRIQYYKIDDIINRKIEPSRIERLPPNLNGFRAIIYVGDSLIIGAPYRGNMNLFQYTNSTKKLESYQDYPKKFPLMNIEVKREVFGLSMAVKPDNSEFVLAYANIGKIEIYDLKSKKPIIISYKGFPTLEENTGLNESSKFIKSNPEALIFCEGIKATNKYIFASILNDKYSNVNTSTGPNREFIREIHVFDWSGNPILKLKLDKFYWCYDIDLTNEYLYTIDDNVENIIYRYDLRKLLN